VAFDGSVTVTNLRGIWGFARARLIPNNFFAGNTIVEGARMTHTEVKSLMLDSLMFSGEFLGDFGGSRGACQVPGDCRVEASTKA
jgi:hypothetical protein